MKDIYFFNPVDDLEIYYGDLPHWRQEGVVYFVTFRLSDSLPQSKLKELDESRALWIKTHRHKRRHEFTKEDRRTYNFLFHERIEKWMEAGYGSCILKEDAVLEIIVETLKFFDGKRYTLDSYVVMPNHIHIIVVPYEGNTLSQITHTWKAYSANIINKLSGKSGQLWRHESYDHIIRNEESYHQIRKYILLNPVKAGLTLSDNALNVHEATLLQENKPEAGSFGHIGKYIAIILLFLCSFAQAQNEAHYIELLNQNHFQGQTEVKVPNGRADIVNDEYAIEVEWAEKWKNSIGQALWYGLQTNKKPGIVLVMKDVSDRKYGIMLQSALDYAGIGDQIKVWFYPEDFGRSYESEAKAKTDSKQMLIQKNGNYTKNKNSGVRHNSKCSNFDCKNCVPCGPNEGKPCGICKG